MIWVIRSGALGDLLLGLPVLRAIVGAASSRVVTCVAPASLAKIVHASVGMAGNLVILGPESDHLRSLYQTVPSRPAEVEALASNLSTASPTTREGHRVGAIAGETQRRGFTAGDLVIVWSHSYREIVDRLRAVAPMRVVAGPPFPSAGDRTHLAEWLASAVTPIGATLPAGWDDVPWIHLPRGPIEGTTQGDTLPRPFAIVHPGSGSRQKWWPTDRWVVLITWLLTTGRSVVVLEGEADGDAVTPLVSRDWRQGRVVGVRGLAVEAVAQLLTGADLFVGNDSGIAHLAAGLGIATVAIFGPTDPEVWRPRGPAVAVVGGTPFSAWPHAAREMPEAVGEWPEVCEVVRAVEDVTRDQVPG